MIKISNKKVDDSIYVDLIQINADDKDIESLIANETLFIRWSYGELSKYNSGVVSSKNTIDDIRSMNIYAPKHLIKNTDQYKNYQYNKGKI